MCAHQRLHAQKHKNASCVVLVLIVVVAVVVVCKGLDRVSSPSWAQTHYIAKDALELPISLLLPPVCWNFRHVPPL